MINKCFSLLAQTRYLISSCSFLNRSNTCFILVSLRHFTEATALNCYQMCPGQTGLKFKGDFPVDCMSEHPGVQRHNMSGTPGRDERCVNLWPCAPSLVLTSWCPPLHWLRQANMLVCRHWRAHRMKTRNKVACLLRIKPPTRQQKPMCVN